MQTTQPVQALSGTSAPLLGQIGGGIQYQLGTPPDKLINEGVIKFLGIDYDKNRIFRTS